MLRQLRSSGFCFAAMWLALAACSRPVDPGNSDAGATTFTSQLHAAKFPIDSGAHAGLDCYSCHVATANTFTEFNCAGCHGHEQTVTNLLHNGVSGYAYTGTSCYSCHADGAKVPFDHRGISGGCALCHAAGAQFAVLPIAGFTHPSMGASDCSSCHHTATWQAQNAPQYISVGGFAVSQPPATSPITQMGISNLPHPTVATSAMCSSCHPNAVGKPSSGYDHLSSLINFQCDACHEAGSDLLGTPWNNAATMDQGAGDSRPYTLLSVVASFHGNSRTITYPNHFYPADCGECHLVPPANGVTTTGPDYLNAWTFPHRTSNMTNPSTCIMCHTNGVPH